MTFNTKRLQHQHSNLPVISLYPLSCLVLHFPLAKPPTLPGGLLPSVLFVNSYALSPVSTKIRVPLSTPLLFYCNLICHLLGSVRMIWRILLPTFLAFLKAYLSRVFRYPFWGPITQGIPPRRLSAASKGGTDMLWTAKRNKVARIKGGMRSADGFDMSVIANHKLVPLDKCLTIQQGIHSSSPLRGSDNSAK